VQVAHARGLGWPAAMYSAMSCAPPGARSRTKPGAARLRAPGGGLRPPALRTQLQPRGEKFLNETPHRHKAAAASCVVQCSLTCDARSAHSN